MVIGDLNARVGEEQIMEISGRVRDRKSKDKMVNANGRALFSLLDVYDMVILNGTTSSDPLGEITFMNKNGQSTIDLCCVGGCWKDDSVDVQIGQKLWSDHMPL